MRAIEAATGGADDGLANGRAVHKEEDGEAGVGFEDFEGKVERFTDWWEGRRIGVQSRLPNIISQCLSGYLKKAANAPRFKARIRKSSSHLPSLLLSPLYSSSAVLHQPIS